MGEVKREQECNTTDDWRHRAYHLESEWARCSQACAVMQAERDALAAEVAQADLEYQDAITLAQMNKDRLDVALAEVAKLRAACAAKDEAICTLRDHITVGMYRAVPHLADVAADGLSTDAGKGWVDASGAVEAEVPTVVQDNLDGTGTIKLSYRGVLSRVEAMIGKRVLIMLKPEAP